VTLLSLGAISTENTTVELLDGEGT
jgi:hypothetical protein